MNSPRIASDPGFVVLGESIADVVRSADGAERTHPGGSPMNVAYGLARLGRSVTLVTELGADEHGGLIRAHLASSGVNVLTPPAQGRRTPSAVASVREDGSAHYTFDISWGLPDVPAGAMGGHMHCGSIGAFLEPGATSVERYLAGRRGIGTTSFDPNIRPALLGSRDDARARAERLVALSDVVKASDEDLDWLYPGEDRGAVMERWLGTGPGLVVVTAGGAGAVAVSAAAPAASSSVFDVAPVAVDVVDTVGAGDAFMAALLDGLASAGLLGAGCATRLASVSPATLQAVLDRAAAAAAITVGRQGADPPTRDELSGR